MDIIAIELGVLIGLILLIVIMARTSGELKYQYLVSYSFKGEKGDGFGEMTLNRSGKIESSEDVDSVRKYIQENQKFEKVVIINFIRLKK